MHSLRPSRGPDETLSAARGHASMNRRSAFTLLAGGTALLVCELLSPEKKASKEQPCMTLDDLPDGASLIEQNVAVKLTEGGVTKWVRTRIIRIGAELGILMGEGVTGKTYRIANKVFTKPATPLVTSIVFNKPTRDICIEARRRIPPFGTSGNALVSGKEYEQVLRDLATTLPPSMTTSTLEARYTTDFVPPGTEYIALELEEERRDANGG